MGNPIAKPVPDGQSQPHTEATGAELRPVDAARGELLQAPWTWDQLRDLLDPPPPHIIISWSQALRAAMHLVAVGVLFWLVPLLRVPGAPEGQLVWKIYPSLAFALLIVTIVSFLIRVVELSHDAQQVTDELSVSIPSPLPISLRFALFLFRRLR
jgi:hypothetical protein